MLQQVNSCCYGNDTLWKSCTSQFIARRWKFQLIPPWVFGVNLSQTNATQEHHFQIYCLQHPQTFSEHTLGGCTTPDERSYLMSLQSCVKSFISSMGLIIWCSGCGCYCLLFPLLEILHQNEFNWIFIFSRPKCSNVHLIVFFIKSLYARQELFYGGVLMMSSGSSVDRWYGSGYLCIFCQMAAGWTDWSCHVTGDITAGTPPDLDGHQTLLENTQWQKH